MGGLPIVFLPGLLCTGRIYAHQVDALGDAHPILLANHWSAPSIDAIADQILAAAPERFALVGTSMGGYVSFEIMRRAPERVARLVLMSTSAKPDAPERSAARREQVAGFRKYGARAGVAASYPGLVHPARHEDLALKALFNDMAEELGADAFERQIEAIIARADSRPTLAEIAAPALVIVGADDALIPPENAREIAASIKGSRLEELAHCGHMAMLERPETVTELLRDFLS